MVLPEKCGGGSMKYRMMIYFAVFFAIEAAAYLGEGVLF